MTQPRDYTILIIEDEPGLCQAYRIVLEAQGYHVATASNGEEGLVQLAAHKPDLILLDMLMPRMDGISFMRAAHLKKSYPATKVIVFSNLSSSQHMAEIQQIGIYDHVLKAEVNPRQLADMVADALADTLSR